MREPSNFASRLVHQELKHKLKLERFYDDLFYSED